MLKKRGASGIIGLGRCFRIMDDNGNRQLEYDEFHKAMNDFGLNFSDKEI